MRCPGCGARNSDDATWCTQCYLDLRPEGSGGDPAPPRRRRATSGEVADGVPAAHQPRPGGSGGRDIRQRGEVVEWRCATCAGWSPLEAASCETCGTPRRGFGEAPDRQQDPGELGVVGASLLLPGLGHVLAGRTGTGFARAILAVLWLLGGIALVAANAGISTLPGWLLVASAAVLWVATFMDARRLATRRDDEVLTTRRLGVLVLAVTLGLVASAATVMLAGAG